MASYIVIHKAKIEGATRLDAQYYQPQFSANRAKMKSLSCGTVTLGEITSRFAKGIFDIRAEVYSKTGVPFVRVSNLRDGLISDSGLAFIPPEVHQAQNKTALKRGDIVISKTAYPAASLVNLEECNVSQDTIAVKLSDKWKNRLKAPYIVAFLNSKFGILLMEQWFQGNIQMHLALPDAKQIPIPLLSMKFQESIESTYWQIDSLLCDSKKLFQEAERLFLMEFGIDKWKAPTPLSYVKSFAEIRVHQRIDSEYFQPKYDEMVAIIRNKAKEVKQLGEIVSLSKGIEVGSEAYKNEGIPFVRVSDITKFGIAYQGDMKFLSTELYDKLKDEFEPRKNEILITKDATPGIAMVSRSEQKQIISSGILRAKMKMKIDEDYLSLVINSMTTRLQIERDTNGSIMDHWRPDQVKHTLVPLLSENVMTKIGYTVRKALELQRTAKSLVHEMGRKIEEELER